MNYKSKIVISMVFCSKCGYENEDNNKKCEKCGEFLLKTEFFEVDVKENFKDILKKENQKAINQISIETYNTVIYNIINMGNDHLNKIIKNNNININNESILNKIGILTQAYVKIGYKTSGADLGHYAYNSIFLDDRLYESQQIATLIHELAHHLFSEIFEELLMYVWECGKSDAIEAFAWFTVTGSPLVALTNEYCAHTVEGRFVPHGYQNYGSFTTILKQNFDAERDKEQINFALFLGNTLAHDIIYVLERFITPELREEIKEQFKKDSFPPRYDQIGYEITGVMPDDMKIKTITDMLNSGFEAAKKENMQEVLENYKNAFTASNENATQ